MPPTANHRQVPMKHRVLLAPMHSRLPLTANNPGMLRVHSRRSAIVERHRPLIEDSLRQAQTYLLR